MKKILGLAFAGAMLLACGGSNKNATGMQNTTASTVEPAPQVPLTEPTPPSTQPVPGNSADQSESPNPSPQ